MSATSTDVSTQDVVERALQLSRTQGCVVIAQESSEANLRWAANTLTTNGVMRSRSLTVIATAPAGEGTATGVVSRSNVSLDEIETLVREAEQRAEHGRPADDAHPLIAGSDVPESGRGWDDPPAETSIGVFADLAATLGAVFGEARSGGRELFGFAEHQVSTVYLGTSTGVRVRHVQPTGRIEVTGKTADWSRSSWVGHSTRDFSDIDMSDVDAELPALEANLRLDPAGVSVPERVPQQFPGDTVDLVMKQGPEIAPLPFHGHAKGRWVKRRLPRARQFLSGRRE